VPPATVSVGIPAKVKREKKNIPPLDSGKN
jgi:hypothetical protein